MDVGRFAFAWIPAMAWLVASIPLAHVAVGERRSRSAIEAASRQPTSTAALAPVARVLAPQPDRAPAALVLGDFDREGDLRRWVAGRDVRATLVDAPGRPGSSAARVEFPPRGLSGLELSGLPRDWRRFASLRLAVYSEARKIPIVVGVRVDDRRSGPEAASRYETGVPIGSGWTEVRVPLEEVARRVDLADVLRIVLYVREAGGTGEPVVLLLDELRLEAPR